MDIKKLMAISSILHMTLGTLGMLCITSISTAGVISMCVAHGFTALALFLVAGCIVGAANVRCASYLLLLGTSSTAARALLFLMCWTNLAFPWSFSFIAELYLLLGIL